jgi:hypothetical protein
MTKTEVAKLVALLAAAFPASRWSEASQRVYEDRLADLDVDSASKAVARLIGTAEFMPTIAAIRSATADLRLGPVRPGGDAWGDVQDAVRQVGGYEPCPDFADPVVARCVDRFGWRALCFEGDGTADRARFIELYDRLAREQRLDQVSGVPLPKPLSGLAELRRLPEAPEQPKPLVSAPSPERPATAKPGGKDGPFRVELSNLVPAIPEPPARTWTGRRLTKDELDAELGV